jgi:hypothetical protein
MMHMLQLAIAKVAIRSDASGLMAVLPACGRRRLRSRWRRTAGQIQSPGADAGRLGRDLDEAYGRELGTRPPRVYRRVRRASRRRSLNAERA